MPRRPFVRALAGGFAGTVVMTAALAVETKLVEGVDGIVDYDDSDHVVIAACRLLRRPVPESEVERKAIFAAVHWGYGSAVAMAYVPVRRRTHSDLAAGLWFLAGCQAMAMTLFPTLGDTPPPWRWRPAVVASSIGVHALYAATVAAVTRRRSVR